MPSFFPISPWIIGSLLSPRKRPSYLAGSTRRACPALSVAQTSDLTPPLQLDFDINPGRKIQAHQRPNRAAAWLEHIDQPFVCPDFELLLRILVDKRRPDYAELFDPGWQRNGASHLGARR